MTKLTAFRGIGTMTLRSDYCAFQALRYAAVYYERHGDAFLKQISDQFEIGPLGKVQPISAPRPVEMRAQDRLSAEAAGFVWTERHLAKGLEPAEAQRQVLGRIRTLGRAWPGSVLDRTTRWYAYRRGVKMALRRAAG